MPDGKRKRRHSPNAARRRWYAQHRSHRFCRRFGWQSAGFSGLEGSTATSQRHVLAICVL